MHVSRSLWQRTLGLVVVILAACGGSSSDGPVPTASISIAANVPVNAVLTLGGSGTSTNSGNLTYRWTLVSKPTGSAATISDVTLASPTITPDVVGTYSFGLTVSDGSKSTSLSGSTTAAVTASPTIITDIVEPLSGTLVQLSLSSTSGVNTITWTVDGTAIGTGFPLVWDTTTVANGRHVVGAHILFFANYSVDVTRTVQVTQNAVSISSGAVSASNGLITAIIGAASSSGAIVRVDATLDGVAIGSLAVPNACTDSTGAACVSALNGYSFSGAVTSGAHVVVVTATDGIGNNLAIQLRLTVT